MKREVNLPTPPSMVVTAWKDPILDSRGHYPGSPYIEQVWLGALGPAATWAWVRLARIAQGPAGARVDMEGFAQSLGLGAGMAPNAAISRALGRLVAFGAAQRSGNVLVVRRALPDVPQRLLMAQPAGVRRAHRVLAHHTARLTTPGPVPAAGEGAGAGADMQDASL